jgi:alpha-L-fucosidase 2
MKPLALTKLVQPLSTALRCLGLAASIAILAPTSATSAEASATPSTNQNRLWYRAPAKRWNEALPIGNGRLAAMAFGSFPRDRLQLNEETIWEGESLDRTNPRALAALPGLRELLFTGRNAEAAKIIDENFVSPRRHVDPYQSAGELLIDFVGHGSAPATGPWMVNPPENDPNPWIAGYGLLNYQRDLDLSTGLTTSRGKFEHVMQHREGFVSWADDLICYRVTCDAGEGNFDLSLQRELDVVAREVPDNGLLVLEGRIGRNGRPFCLIADVRIEGGTRRARGARLEVRGANAVEVRIAIASSFISRTDLTADPRALCRAKIAAASGFTWNELKERHVRQHREVFARASLALPETANSSLPTDERLKKLQDGADDPALTALYFNYGRYLLAGSSRAGGLPANLQGKWCGEMTPAWNSNYTTNINVQMNYWPAGPANLTDRAEAYLRWAESLVEPGRRTARQLYGCGGWVVHHNSDIYGATEIFDGPAGMWTMGSAWISAQLIDLWRFNGDRQWLTRTWPVA